MNAEHWQEDSHHYNLYSSRSVQLVKFCVLVFFNYYHQCVRNKVKSVKEKATINVPHREHGVEKESEETEFKTVVVVLALTSILVAPITIIAAALI